MVQCVGLIAAKLALNILRAMSVATLSNSNLGIATRFVGSTV